MILNAHYRVSVYASANAEASHHDSRSIAWMPAGAGSLCLYCAIREISRNKEVCGSQTVQSMCPVGPDKDWPGFSLFDRKGRIGSREVDLIYSLSLGVAGRVAPWMQRDLAGPGNLRRQLRQMPAVFFR